ncbi:ExeM/NucH family extracellular endonuclease [Demequina sp.]|uniref:ExeM/NucH family extracellular endonuclease n=1 Tax=Demequina sp. TaxID=2050685 RepID=UPI003A89C640
MRRRTAASTVLIALGVSALTALPASAADPGDLLISEYIEGSSNNKAVEIYNGTGAAVDLAPYTLTQHSNGSANTSVTFSLDGTLAAGDTYVVAHAAAAAPILEVADETTGSGLFNGDDALVLRNGGAVVDSFGQVGVDPGTEWPGGGLDDTLRRRASVCAGDTEPTDAFDASLEWDALARDTFDGLGVHETSCDGGPVVDVAPAVASIAPADGAVGVGADAVVEVVFTEPVALAPGAITVTCSASGVLDGTVAGGPTSFSFVPASPLAAGEECAVAVSASAVTDLDANDPPDAMEGDASASFTVAAAGVTRIGDLQGTGDTSPYVGQTVTIEGVVVGDYEGPAPTLRGFYVQSRDGDVDGDPATSEGVFVYQGSRDTVALGDVVSVTGPVEEYQGQTQMGYTTAVEVLESGASVTPAPVSLPFEDAAQAERYEGMSVVFEQELFVTEFYLLGRFGEITLSGGDRLDQPTAVVEPGAQANALQAANDLNRIKLDDLSNAQNPDPILYGGGAGPLSADNPLRGGDSVTGLTGVMTYTWAGNAASGNAWRVRPAAPEAELPVFESHNPRPVSAPEVGGSVKVASFNVLNYFLSIDGVADACGPVGFEQDCRGANTPYEPLGLPEDIELTRQTDKLVAALLELDADVIGIMEMENTPGVEPLAALAERLNAAEGTDTWSFVDTGVVGTDVIRVGVLYDSAVVSPEGAHAVLDASTFPGFDDDNNRPSVAQSFSEVATGETFTVVVNHWKSKGCGDATGLDADQGDGASCWNETRTGAATSLVEWLATSPTGVEDPDVMIIGDLNSYAQEDPIDVLREAGYVEMGGGDYSYVFDGQWGSLDYVFASASLAEQVTGSAHVHINADEASVLDYNTDFKSAAQIESLYAADWYRTSDHDPVLVGLDLASEVEVAPCAVDYTIHGQWPGGFISQVWLTNTGGEPLSAWELGWEFAGDERIVNLWSGSGSQDGASVTVGSLPWNAVVQPGGSVTFGFVGVTTAGALPVDSFTLGGVPCGG